MRIGIIAGESSGDLLGAGLIRELRNRVPNLHSEGVAGPAMQAAGCEVLEHSEALAVMGLIEPLKEIPRLLRLRKSLFRRWIANPPDVVVGIDSPDFNLGLLLKLKKAGIRTVQYVSPSVWAWRQNRIHKIRNAADCVLCLLPFEKQFYDERGVTAVFVGHPMAERMSADPDRAAARRTLGLGTETIVAVLPGSRRGEIERLGPLFIAACKLIVEDQAFSGISFVAPMATSANRSQFEQLLRSAGMSEHFAILDGQSELALTASDVALMSSGTATLEAALLKTPLVAAYAVSAVTFAIASIFRLIKTPYISLPNLLTDEPHVPELLQQAASPAALRTAVCGLLVDQDRRQAAIAAFAKLRPMLARGADARAAEAVLAVANEAR